MSESRQPHPPPRPDRAARRRACRIAFCAALLAASAGCGTPPVRVTPVPVTPPGPVPAPPVAHGPNDASYDWHGLVIAPFGSVLKDIPIMLHEVLLFLDEARDGAAADDAECYSADAPAPRFLGRMPDEYLLCFKQNRLSRIQASVRLSSAEASEVFANACAAWLKNAAPTTTVAVASSADARSADTCEGDDGAIRFSGRLGEEPGRMEAPHAEPSQTETQQSETALSIILDSVPNP